MAKNGFFNLKSKSLMLFNIMIAVLLLGVALSYFGITDIADNTQLIVLLTSWVVLGIEIGILGLIKQPPKLMDGKGDAAEIGRIFVALIFAAMAIVLFPPLLGMGTIIGGEVAGTIVGLGVLLSLLVSFTK